MARRRKLLSEEDKVLWKRVTSTVEPTADRANLFATSKKQSRVDLQNTFAGAMSIPKETIHRTVKLLPVKPVIPPIKPAIPQHNQAIDHKTRKKIVKGRMPIEARIDLHGMNQNNAIAKLRGFLQQAQFNDYRLVLVITGKGDAGNGVLRRQVPNWLTNNDLANIVSGFQESHISHGGSGALYVRLRRL